MKHYSFEREIRSLLGDSTSLMYISVTRLWSGICSMNDWFEILLTMKTLHKCYSTCESFCMVRNTIYVFNIF